MRSRFREKNGPLYAHIMSAQNARDCLPVVANIGIGFSLAFIGSEKLFLITEQHRSKGPLGKVFLPLVTINKAENKIHDC